MRVHVVGLDLHLGAMPDRAVHNRVHLGGRTVQLLRVDHHRAALDVPGWGGVWSWGDPQLWL
jgi:hypothetical protein